MFCRQELLRNLLCLLLALTPAITIGRRQGGMAQTPAQDIKRKRHQRRSWVGRMPEKKGRAVKRSRRWPWVALAVVVAVVAVKGDGGDKGSWPKQPGITSTTSQFSSDTDLEKKLNNILALKNYAPGLSKFFKEHEDTMTDEEKKKIVAILKAKHKKLDDLLDPNPPEMKKPTCAEYSGKDNNTLNLQYDFEMAAF